VHLNREIVDQLVAAGLVLLTLLAAERPTLVRAAAVGAVGILFEAAGSVEKLIEQYLVLLGRSENASGMEDVSRRCEKATAAVAGLNASLYALEPSLTELAHHSPSTMQVVEGHQ
jgi:hypothetical protein